MIVRHFSERKNDLLVIDITKEKNTNKIVEFLNLPSLLVTAMPYSNKTLWTQNRRNMKKDSEEQISPACAHFRAWISSNFGVVLRWCGSAQSKSSGQGQQEHDSPHLQPAPQAGCWIGQCRSSALCRVCGSGWKLLRTTQGSRHSRTRSGVENSSGRRSQKRRKSHLFPNAKLLEKWTSPDD